MPVKPVQPRKAAAPMLVTLSGIVIPVKPVQSKNAKVSILVIPYGITEFLHPTITALVSVLIIALQLFLLSNVLLPEDTFISDKFSQP